jgi:hypothetical protein
MFLDITRTNAKKIYYEEITYHFVASKNLRLNIMILWISIDEHLSYAMNNFICSINFNKLIYTIQLQRYDA